ncbi:hypothetical protein MGH68_03010 [Erysipelothrix sp. D19-032]
MEKAYESAGYHRKQIGVNHLAFGVTTPHDVDCIRQALSGFVDELYADAYPHAKRTGCVHLLFEDPDRIKLEVVALES